MQQAIIYGIGVGIFLSITLIRSKKNIPLRTLLLIFYALVIVLSFFAPTEFVDTEASEERELLFILAPTKISVQIMEDVNREFGISSEANGIIFSLPTEKAFKI